MLFKLPQRFDPHFQSLLASGRTSFPTWDEVLPSLRQIEGHSAYRARGVGANGALIAHGGDKPKEEKEEKIH